MEKKGSGGAAAPQQVPGDDAGIIGGVAGGVDRRVPRLRIAEGRPDTGAHHRMAAHGEGGTDHGDGQAYGRHERRSPASAAARRKMAFAAPSPYCGKSPRWQELLGRGGLNKKRKGPTRGPFMRCVRQLAFKISISSRFRT